MEKVLVTGGAGFIGSHVSQELSRRGYSVVVLDDLSTGNVGNLAGIDNIDFVQASISDSEMVSRMAAGCDYAVHLAAIASVPRCEADPVSAYATNVEGSRCVLESCIDAGVRKVVVASSSAVYGNTSEVPIAETQTLDPISVYAKHKVELELLCAGAGSRGLGTIVFRFFNVYGTRQSPDSDYAAVIPKFIQRVLQGDVPTIYGDGTTTRDFVNVRDIAKVTVDSLSSPVQSGVFNIGSGRQISLNDLIDALSRICSFRIFPNYSGFRKGDVLHSCSDISLSRRELGFRPSIPLDEGLRELAEEYIEKQTRFSV